MDNLQTYIIKQIQKMQQVLDHIDLSSKNGKIVEVSYKTKIIELKKIYIIYMDQDYFDFEDEHESFLSYATSEEIDIWFNKIIEEDKEE